MSRIWEDRVSRSLNREPLEDSGFQHATQKQLNFLEILRNDLCLSLQARNAHIRSIVGGHFKDDVWSLSRAEASQVIDKFKQWKEEKRNG
jgi:hypothetical protein